MARTRVVGCDGGGCDTGHSVNPGGFCPVSTVAWDHIHEKGRPTVTSDNATPGKAATFVLVPGYWLGAWAWDAVAAELRAAGHDVHAVTPAGQAERAEESAPGADVETQIADLVRLIEDADIREVVLVAHSGANMAVTGAADRIPERIANVVYVDSGPMPSGMAASTSTTPRRAPSWRRRSPSRAADGASRCRRSTPPPTRSTSRASPRSTWPPCAGAARPSRSAPRRRRSPAPTRCRRRRARSSPPRSRSTRSGRWATAATPSSR
ncbi:alpha/beta fold hydrolase [Actinomadura madurae]|uniref:alpha/beta fold hydrolase n=1 Tax=Actinomadura madurae TaxID=1993 RepID=UPI0035592954